MDNWTVSDVTEHADVNGQYLANAIISDKSKCPIPPAASYISVQLQPHHSI